MSERSGKAQTVLGLVDPSELGHTQTHEHLLSDLSWYYDVTVESQPAGVRGRAMAPICLENYGWVRHNWTSNRHNMSLTSESDATAEMRQYHASGGGSVVDATSKGIARDPEGLARISRATGVGVVMGAGYYVVEAHPVEVGRMSEEELAESMVRDVVEGADGTGIRSGIIGEIGLSYPVHPDEEKVLRAAAKAQVETGAPLLIHPGRDPAAPGDAMRIVREAEGDPERTVMSHIDRTIFSLGEILELAQTGCYVEFDLFGQESSYYPLAPIDMPNDATRINYLMGLMDAGFDRKLVIAQDICTKVHLTKYGGEGYSHILENVVPIMRRKGMSVQEVDTILVHNPARILAFT